MRPVAGEVHNAEVVDGPADPQPAPRREHVFTVSILTLRWVFLAAVTLIAFRQSIAVTVVSTAEHSLNGYLWLMPVAAILSSIAVARRERTELPIHDRQTDIIVGVIGLGFALMLQAILMQRYSQYFHLLRIDLIALWFFLLSSSILLFGLRPVTRFSWVWILLMSAFPLWYQLAVIYFGGNRTSAGAASLAVAALATAVSVGRTVSRAMVGAASALLIGTLVLAGMALVAPDAPLLAFQLLPATLAMGLVGVSLYGYARRGLPKRLLDRKIAPLAARQVWAAIPLVLVTALGIALVRLPQDATHQATEDGLVFGRPLSAPAGWHQVDQTEYPWVRKVYGRSANLIRQRFVADRGNRAWDKFARPRTVVVDSTSTWLPFSLKAYPANVLYDESSSRISDPTEVDLGRGISGSLQTVVDDRRFVTYNLLTWTWRNADSAQRILVASVDNHEDQAVFPEPTSSFAATTRTILGVFFRGNQATWDSDPVFKDVDLLTDFGRALVTAQVRQVGRPQ